MAIFTDTRELNRQASTDHLDRVKGMDKAKLALLGYKDTGERNWWGKVNPLIGGIGTNKLAQKVIGKNPETGTDTLAALKGTEQEAINNTVNKIALAANIASLGTASPIIGAVSKGINMVTGNGNTSDLVKGVSNMAKKKESMDALNSGTKGMSSFNPNDDGSYTEQTSGGVPVAGSGASEEDFLKWLEDNPNGTREEFGKLPRVAEGAEDVAGGKLGSVLGTPGVGDAIQSGIGAIMSEVALHEAEKEAVVTSGGKSMNQFSYL